MNSVNLSENQNWNPEFYIFILTQTAESFEQISSVTKLKEKTLDCQDCYMQLVSSSSLDLDEDLWNIS